MLAFLLKQTLKNEVLDLDTRELLMHLSKLENGLDRYSFTELNTNEANRLKKSFESFKNGLEEKVFGMPTPEPVEVSLKNKKVKSKPLEDHSMIAKVSHEIRTPLNGIVGFIDLLKETELSPKQQELIKALDTASGNLTDIINELLEFSKLASGHETFENVPFNLKNLITEVAFLCETLITDSQVELSVHLDKNLPEQLLGDPSKLSQILLNLLGNAVKFVEKGKISLEAVLKSDQQNRVYVEFLVADTGIGIANDKLQRIFESYKQAEDDTQLKYGGSGLGLSIVKELVDRMDGLIAVKSALGAGSTFKVTLPFEKTKKQDIALPKRPGKSVPRSLKHAKILVFEDNVLNQQLMENRLKSWGCKPFITDNGLYGLQLLENHEFDLVLMDLRMPKMNGFQITECIRQNRHDHIRTVPIIALTADFSIADKEYCKRIGITDYILKPYNADELQRTMQELIAEREKQSEREISQINIGQASALINLNLLYEECMGEKDTLTELIQLFKKNMYEFIGNVRMHLTNNDSRGIGFAVHKIKSSLKMLEATTLAQICSKLTEASDAAAYEALEKYYKQFLNEYPKVEEAIDIELNKL